MRNLLYLPILVGIVGCLTSAVLLAVVSDPDNRRVVVSVLLFSAGLTLGDGLALLLARQTEKRLLDAIKTDITSLPEEDLVRAITPLAGDKGIASVVAKTVLDNALYYTDYFAHATLTYGASDLPSSRTHLQVTAQQGMSIHNPTDRTQPFPLEMVFYLLNVPVGGSTVYERMEFRLLDRNGVEREKEIWDREELARQGDPAPGSDDDSIRLTHVFQIGPGQSGSLLVCTRTWEPIDKGDFGIITKRKCVNMVASVMFPDDSFSNRVYFSHPSSSKPSVCKESFLGRKKTAEVHGGLLPHQGIRIGWKRAIAVTDSSGGQAPSSAPVS